MIIFDGADSFFFFFRVDNDWGKNIKNREKINKKLNIEQTKLSC